MESKLWLDVTTLLQWQRPAVGVVRVEAEAAACAMSFRVGNVAFCRYNGAGGYESVPRDSVRIALDRVRFGTVALPAQKPEPVLIGPALVAPEHDRLRDTLVYLINKLPTGMRRRTLRFAAAKKEAYTSIRQGLASLHRGLRILANTTQPIPAQVLAPQAQNKPTQPLTCPFGRADVYLSMGADWNMGDLSYLHKLKSEHGFKAVLFCYDVIPIKYPHLTLEWVADIFVRYYYHLLWTADEVLCISRCSERDLHSLATKLGTPVPKTHIVRLGSDVPDETPSGALMTAECLIEGRFILFVSTIERRKNHEILYRAYVELVERGIEDLPKLVFVGMPGWGVTDLMNDLRLDPRTAGLIIALNHVTDPQLASLYKHCLFTVYPSLYEGWGLPVAESLAAGKFCVCSNAASLPEVGGDLVEYVDPWDVQGWADRLQHFSAHPDLLAEKEARIQHSYKATEWSETSSAIIERAYTYISTQTTESLALSD